MKITIIKYGSGPPNDYIMGEVGPTSRTKLRGLLKTDIIFDEIELTSLADLQIYNPVTDEVLIPFQSQSAN